MDSKLSPAEIEAKKQFPTPLKARHSDLPAVREDRKKFVRGADWQKEQDKELIRELRDALLYAGETGGQVNYDVLEKAQATLRKGETETKQEVNNGN